MSKEIRQMNDKVKKFKQFVNESENNDFILNNDNVKTYTWTSGGKEHTIKYHLSRDIFKGLYDAVLLGGEFANTYGHGETEKDAVESLKLRVIQLRNKRDVKNKALHLRNVSGSLIGKKIKYKGIEQTIIDTNETEEWVITDKSIPDGIKLLWSNVELMF